jgi:hypothetical protein
LNKGFLNVYEALGEEIRNHSENVKKIEVKPLKAKLYAARKL